MAERHYHEPVMVRETLALLLTDPDGIYLDGTLGGGGHAAAILDGLREGKLIGFDRDPDAIAACRGAFGEELARGERSRVELVHGSYVLACSREELRGQVQGILLDLGVSSHQLDEPSRGFSYRFDAPLDLRFGGEASNEPTAAELLASLDERAIADILYRYGEERSSRRIARAIVAARRHAPIRTTGQLRAIVERCVHPRQRTDVLSRVFQALRIAVNRELEELERFLSCVPSLLCRGGRIVVITYHSLEDRIVKHSLREMAGKAQSQQSPLLRILTPKPLRPQPEEIARNRRARSAKLRAAERV
ncbi:MAG: 16S rRNA (cytosine(1402)-N(4))-methyltransferase RsmH [Chlorobiota bacterium]|nr:MAG: 16S rRNA (cytosine(1402)-N(4))-methyltransferase RsmH [Chlorobiota bacterium]